MKHLTIFMISLFAQGAFAQTNTPEVAQPGLNDIAIVVPDQSSPSGAVIYFNPRICSQIGAACAFFRVHEHGHVQANHQFTGYGFQMEKERDADEFAARNANPQAVLAAWNLFMSGWSSQDWRVYGSPFDRALRLCRFAKGGGNWVGPDEAC